jgi:hypothetical protein
MTENNSFETSPAWLQKLKNESWEAELLVSAIAIFAIFSSFTFFNWVCDMFIDRLNPNQYFIGYIITFLGFLAFGILGALFVIHLTLRAYWIGLVGLNSVFPDYSLEDSAYSKTFTEKMMRKLPKLQRTIQNLDEICSVIYSVAFTLLLMYLYLGIFSSIYLLLFNLLSDYISIYVLLIPLILMAIVYLFQATLTVIANLKKFKNITRIQKWYFHSTIWGSAMLYGPLYKNLLQITMIFGSNFKKKKALVRSMIFMLVFGMILGMYKLFQSNVTYLLISDSFKDTSRAYSEFYASNKTDSDFLLVPEIFSEIITQKTFKIFVPLFEYEKNLMYTACDISSTKLGKKNIADKQKRWQANLDCYATNIKVYIDNQPITVDFLKMDHPKTGQFGLIGFINLNEIPEGRHRLKIAKEVSSDLEKSWEIPFYNSSN